MQAFSGPASPTTKSLVAFLEDRYSSGIRFIVKKLSVFTAVQWKLDVGDIYFTLLQ